MNEIVCRPVLFSYLLSNYISSLVWHVKIYIMRRPISNCVRMRLQKSDREGKLWYGGGFPSQKRRNYYHRIVCPTILCPPEIYSKWDLESKTSTSVTFRTLEHWWVLNYQRITILDPYLNSGHGKRLVGLLYRVWGILVPRSFRDSWVRAYTPWVLSGLNHLLYYQTV